MPAPAPRLSSHRLMFLIAYAAIAALVLFARPFGVAEAVDVRDGAPIRAGLPSGTGN